MTDIVKQLLALRAEGLNNTQIAARIGTSRNWVSRALIRAGHPADRRELPSAAELVELLTTHTAAELGRTYGCNPNSIQAKISNARKRGEIPRTPPPPAPLPPPTPVDPSDYDWDNVPCKRVDPELFFPHIPRSQEGASLQANRQVREAHERACGHCPLRMPCYGGALEREEPWGIWGGVLFSGGKPAKNQPVRGAA